MPQSRKKPVVIVTRKLPDAVETRMMELFDARLNLDDHKWSQAELAAAMKSAVVLVPTVTDRVDAALIAGAGAHVDLARSQRGEARQLGGPFLLVGLGVDGRRRRNQADRRGQRRNGKKPE